jgi:hypothetical protein
MAGDAEQVGGGKLRRRAAMLMTGAALTGFYMWMQPAALGTLETNSAQAADGTGGCIMKLGNEDVRVNSRELCGTAPPAIAVNLAPVEAPIAPAAEPPADLLRTSSPMETVRAPAPSANRFAAARPRMKPDAPALAEAAPETDSREQRDLVEDEDRWREEGSERERGPDRDERASFDGGDREYCERDDRGDGGERHSGGGEGRWGH